MKREILAIAGALGLVGCGSAPPPEAAPPAAVAVAPAPPPPPAASRGAELVREARSILSPAWRDANGATLRKANEAAHASPNEAQFDEQLTKYQTEELAKVLVAMGKAGGPEVTAFCLELAEDEAQPKKRRLDALGVLEIVDPSDAGRTRRKTLAAAIAPEVRPNVKDAGAVVAMLSKDFKRCYQKALEKKPDLAVKGQLSLRVDAEGTVTSSKVTGPLPPDLARCVQEAGAAARFAPPDAGFSLVIVPITFAQN